MTTTKEIPMQDAPASVETTYTISVGEGFEGRLEGRTDQDWVRVELVAGRSYDIRLTGVGYDGIENPHLRVINSAGEEVAVNGDADVAAWDLTSMVEFSPDTGGVYYLSAGNYLYTSWNTIGPYLMTITDEEDNHPGTPHTVSPNGRFNGTLDDKSDEDWIRVELVAGNTYTITLGGTGPDAGADTVLRLYDSEGEQVAFNDDVDHAAGKVNSLVTFTPAMTGTYYIGAGAYRGNPNQDNSGRYQVTVYDAEAAAGLTITGTEEADYRHNELVGGPGDDVLDGGAGYDWLEGGAGADVIRGGPGVAMARYRYSDAGVEVNLEEGTARGGHAEGDTFPGKRNYGSLDAYGELVAVTRDSDVNDLLGSAYDDILVGNRNHNILLGYYGDDELEGREGGDILHGGPGADRLKGGDGVDNASYIFSDAAVEVRLHDGTARGGEAQGDTFPGTMMVGYTDPDGSFMLVEVPDIENLTGSDHADILVGAHGDNVLVGWVGDDILDGREGDDSLLGGEGNDELHGGEGDDVLAGGNGDDHLQGGEGDDRLLGSDGNDELHGGEGDDLLVGGAGEDTLAGGTGLDTAYYLLSDAGVEVRLYDGVARGGDAEGDTFSGVQIIEFPDAGGATGQVEVSDIERLYGSNYDDILVGDRGDNLLHGFSGADELQGREGDDVLEGGAGGDALSGGPGIDNATYLFSGAGVEVRLHDGTARGGDAEGDMLTGIENLTGSVYADILAGGSGDNRLEGLAGADEIDGGPGSDTAAYNRSYAGVSVNLHDGTARGGDAEGDTLVDIENLAGSNHADVLTGDSGENRLEGGRGDDRLTGLGGADELAGGAGDDTLVGQGGADRLSGGPGSDTAAYNRSYAGVEIRLHEGTARGGDAEGDIFGTELVEYTDSGGNTQTVELPDIENLTGSNHADILVGDLRDNRLTGSRGDDVLDGGAGDDTLVGQGGADRLSGGPGSDTAAYNLSYAGVEIRLHEGTARGGDAEGDIFGTELVEYTDSGGNTQTVELPDIENLTGSDHADILVGDLRDNRLTGGAGDDMLDGGAGDDTLVGQGGADRLSGGPGSDTAAYNLSYAGVSVNLHEGTARGGDAEGDTLVDIENLAGSNHADVLTGDAGENRLEGGRGDDLLIGRDGADVLVGGPGRDAAMYLDSPAGVQVRLHDGTARGGHAEGDTFPVMQTIDYEDTDGIAREVEVADIEGLYGSDFEDILAGDMGDNLLAGFSGNDELHGREGDDNLFGGMGDDELYGGEGDDALEGGPGADVLRGGDGNDSIDYLNSGMGVEVRLHDGTARGGDAGGDTFAGIENLTGSDHADILAGDPMDNLLQGKGGNDVLEGRGGNDRLEGAFGDDVLNGGEGDDVLAGQGGADRLIGGPGRDTAAYSLSYAGVEVRLHNGTLRGGDAEGDTFAGTEIVEYTDRDGNTRMVELPDVRHLTGSDHADILAGDLRDNWLRGGGGDDTLYGGPGGGNDVLQGGYGNDSLYGGIGDDHIEGNAGNDLLRGGPDDDRLIGGAGDDTYFFTPGGGDDVIDGFGTGADKIDLTAFEDIRSIADLVVVQEEDNLEVDLSGHGGGSVTLLNTDEADLMDEDFIFFSDDTAAMI